MNARHWAGDRAGFRLEWAGRSWTLRPDGPRPGLYHGELGPLLGLEGIAASGSWSPEALSGKSLATCECRFNRVEVTYTLPDWGGMTVRALWAPHGDDGVDLLVELSARSVGELSRVEVRVVSVLGPADPTVDPPRRWVRPRDAGSTSMSDDGREPDLSVRLTLPPDDLALRDAILCDVGSGWTYAELAHPDDVARRIREGGQTLDACRITRHGLFGYDLERGVVLRARLRGLWLPSDGAGREAQVRMRQFLREPLPLAT